MQVIEYKDFICQEKIPTHKMSFVQRLTNAKTVVGPAKLTYPQNLWISLVITL